MTTCGNCKHGNYAEDAPQLCVICENPDSINTYNRLKKAGINTERSIYHVSKNKHA